MTIEQANQILARSNMVEATMLENALLRLIKEMQVRYVELEGRVTELEERLTSIEARQPGGGE